MDDHGEIPGARDASDVLRGDPFARLVGLRIERPMVVGGMIFALIVLAIVLAPSTGSRFIYTDF